MELLDLVDINGNLLGRTIERGNKDFKDGEYIRLVTVFLKSNDKWSFEIPISLAKLSSLALLNSTCSLSICFEPHSVLDSSNVLCLERSSAPCLS